jgi:YggT family protein
MGIGFLLKFADILFNLLYLIVVCRVLLSWIRPNPEQKWVQFIIQVSEPIMAPFRLTIFRLGMIDLSPIVALIALSFVHQLLVKLILIF